MLSDLAMTGAAIWWLGRAQLLAAYLAQIAWTVVEGFGRSRSPTACGHGRTRRMGFHAGPDPPGPGFGFAGFSVWHWSGARAGWQVPYPKGAGEGARGRK